MRKTIDPMAVTLAVLAGFVLGGILAFAIERADSCQLIHTQPQECTEAEGVVNCKPEIRTYLCPVETLNPSPSTQTKEKER